MVTVTSALSHPSGQGSPVATRTSGIADILLSETPASELAQKCGILRDWNTAICFSMPPPRPEVPVICLQKETRLNNIQKLTHTHTHTHTHTQTG